MLSFSLSGLLGDILAPRPTPKHEFILLLRANQQNKALDLLRDSNLFSNTWIDELDNKGQAAIHIAAGMGALEILLELLSQGANVNKPCASGCTAIHYAAVNGRKGIIELLLRSGGDPSIPNASGQVAAEMCSNLDIRNLLLRDHSLLSASKVLQEFSKDESTLSAHPRTTSKFCNELKSPTLAEVNANEQIVAPLNVGIEITDPPIKRYSNASLSNSDSEDDSPVYTAVGINSTKKTSRKFIPLLDLGSSNEPTPNSGHGSSDNNVPSSFSPADRKEFRVLDPETLSSAPVLSLSELRKSISISPLPNYNSPQKKVSQDGIAGQTEVGVVSPYITAKSIDLKPAVSTHLFNPRANNTRKLASSVSSILASSSSTGSGSVGAVPLAPLGSPSTIPNRLSLTGPISVANPSNGSLPTNNCVAQNYGLFATDDISKVIYSVALETSGVLFLESTNELVEAKVSPEIMGSEATIRKRLLLSCISNKLDEEYVMDILVTVPGLARGRVVDNQLNWLKTNCGLEDEVSQAYSHLLNESVHSLTYLHVAAGFGNAAMCAILLDAGALAWAVDSRGRTPLHVALAWGSKPSQFGDEQAIEERNSQLEELCSLLQVAMQNERGYLPVGENAPVDLLGHTPLGLFRLNAHTEQVSVAAIDNAATPKQGSTLTNVQEEIIPIYSHSKGCEHLTFSQTYSVGDQPSPALTGNDSYKLLSAVSPSPGIMSLLLAPGDKSVLPLQPVALRCGKSPWKAPGIGERDNILFAYSSAKLWSYLNSEFPVAACPLPGRPAWSLFGIASSRNSASNLCSSLVVEHFPRFLVTEADKLARIHNSANKPGGLVNDVDTSPELLSELLFKCCQLTDEQMSRHPSLKVQTSRCSSCMPEVLGHGNDLADFANDAAENIVPYVLENGSAECCLAVVSADYIALCSVGEMDVILAQRYVSERASISGGPVPVASPFGAYSGSPIPDTIADNYLSDRSHEKRRRSRSSLVGMLLTDGKPSSVGSMSHTPLNAYDASGHLSVFGSYLEKHRVGALRFRSSSDDSVSSDSFYTSGKPKLVQNTNSSVRTNIRIFNRSTRDSLLVMTSKCVGNFLSAQEVVDFVALRLGYTAFGGPVGGVNVSTITEASDALIQECQNRGCASSIAVVIILLGTPADPTRRGSPSFADLQPRNSPREAAAPVSSERGTPTLPPLPTTQASIHSRRNSRRNTPATSNLAQQLALAMMLPTSNGNSSSNELPSSRSISRRNTPSSVTIQAYIEASQLGDYSASSISADSLNNPNSRGPLVSPKYTSSNVGICGNNGNSAITVPIFNTGGGICSIPESNSQDGYESARLHHSASDIERPLSGCEGDGDDSNFTLVRDNLSESGVSVSSETYNYRSLDQRDGATREAGSLDRPADPIHLPLPNFHPSNSFPSYGEASPIETCSDSGKHLNSYTAVGVSTATMGSSIATSTSIATTSAAVVASSSPSTDVQSPGVVTTPMSSLRSIFAMVAEEGESGSPFEVRSVRKQLLFQDN